MEGRIEKKKSFEVGKEKLHFIAGARM